jgi:hypothetical protein
MHGCLGPHWLLINHRDFAATDFASSKARTAWPLRSHSGSQGVDTTNANAQNKAGNAEENENLARVQAQVESVFQAGFGYMWQFF